jgi:hypothetical protein
MTAIHRPACGIIVVETQEDFNGFSGYIDCGDVSTEAQLSIRPD